MSSAPSPATGPDTGPVRDADPAHRTGSHLLGEHVVGQRVVVRRLLPGVTGPGGGPAMTDVLGVCEVWDGTVCRVRREDGELVEVRVADIVSGKPVPPRPPVRHRMAPRAVELRVLDLFDGVETAPVGEWLLRSWTPAGERPRRRVNSALVLGDPGTDPATALGRVQEFYAARGQVPTAHVELGSPRERELTDLGWLPSGAGDTHAQLASVSRALRTVAQWARPELEGVEQGRRLLLDDPRVRLRATLSPDGDLVALDDLVVAPEHRRAGWATAALAEALDWAAASGALTAWLHVETDNDPALALYASLGFRTHHSMRYLVHHPR